MRLFAIVIPLKGQVQLVELPDGELPRFRTLQEIVGGHVQAVPLPGDRFMVLNEEGKMRPHGTNQTATAIARAAESILPDDYIAGVAAIIPRVALQ
jgi:hypothetical protein